MINLAMNEMEMKEQAEPKSVLYDVSKYPYGLKIQLDPETVKKLGMTEAPEVGEKMMIMGYVEVCSVYAEPSKGDEKSYSVGLQITDMELKEVEEPEVEEKSVEDTLYSEG